MSPHTSEFCNAINEYVDYWDGQDRSKKECLNGLAFCILRLLDGVAHNFEGNISTLAREYPSKSLHNSFTKWIGNENDPGR